ncbi:hypothetical protein MtrunA17_Chr8g0364421 [Medicago truncatula]|uniref:Uncharacterized protein n=1 Tax=Medicago truncatula TaxID=3880 RepID=A0A396GM57_MEDTR|nr:hypothetical protein MtrunA17_Chr8g0364421 [Medicago truncatula]
MCITGVSPLKLEIEVVDCSPDEGAYCNNCKTSIFAYHRYCTKCDFEICLICCRELRDRKLLGGDDYLHVGYENIEHKETASHDADKPEISELSRSGWHADSYGRIPCPKGSTECDHGFLELRSLKPKNYITELVSEAGKLAEKYQFLFAKEPICPCLKLARDSNNNYIFSPKAVDLHNGDLSHFRWHGSKGEPVIVSNVLDCTSGLSWEPTVMSRAFRAISETTSDTCFWI